MEQLANIIYQDNVHIIVICPYCGQIHRHGSCGDNSLNDYGYRTSHCSTRYNDFECYTCVTNKYTIKVDYTEYDSKKIYREYYKKISGLNYLLIKKDKNKINE